MRGNSRNWTILSNIQIWSGTSHSNHAWVRDPAKLNQCKLTNCEHLQRGAWCFEVVCMYIVYTYVNIHMYMLLYIYMYDMYVCIYIYVYTHRYYTHTKTQEKPTKPNADHVKETDVSAGRIKCRCGVWSVKCGMWSVECKVWSGDWRVWSVKCKVWSVKCGV